MTAETPRRGWLRRALFQVHLWTGLAVAAYAVAISLSGAILVYAPALGARAHAEWRAVPPASVEGRSVVTTAQAVTLVQQARPGRYLLNVQVPARRFEAHVVGLLEANAYRVVFVHPVTSAVSPAVMGRGTVIGWIERLHSNFFAGRSGRVVNGIGGLLLVLLSISGVIVWWPGRARLGRALRIDWRAGWKRVVFDLHNALGVWLLVPVVVLSITGAYFTWPQAYRSAIGRVSPLTSRQAPRSVVPVTPGQALDLDALVARVRSTAPSRPYLRIDLPGGATAPYVVVASATPEAPDREATTTFVDRYDGRLLDVRHGPARGSVGDAIVNWIGPLHTGHFGGPLVHVLWAAFGLAPTLLAVTGTLMWWNRVIVPRRRRGERSTRARMQA